MASRPATDNPKSILLIVFGAIGILGLLLRGGYELVNGIVSFTSHSTTAGNDLESGILNMAAMLFCSLLLLPLIYYSLRRIKALDIQGGGIRPIKAWHLTVLIVGWFFIVLVCGLLTMKFQYGWIMILPFFPFGVAIPVVIFAWIGAGGLPAGSRRRLWSVFGIGMAGGSFVAIIFEYLVVGLGVVILGIVAFTQPDLRALLLQLKNQISDAQNMEATINILAPYLTNPLVFLVLLSFVAGIGPLIEEAAKPLVIWFVGKKLRSPGEGFALGALCGAGFALLEGLLAAGGASQNLGIGLVGRAASSLMHITASGIMGWGIASVLLEKQYGRLAAAYLAAVAIHGLWNGSVLLAVYGALRISIHGNQPDLISALTVLMGAGLLLILFPVILALLPVLNRILRSSIHTQNGSISPKIDV